MVYIYTYPTGAAWSDISWRRGRGSSLGRAMEWPGTKELTGTIRSWRRGYMCVCIGDNFYFTCTWHCGIHLYRLITLYIGGLPSLACSNCCFNLSFSFRSAFSSASACCTRLHQRKNWSIEIQKQPWSIQGRREGLSYVPFHIRVLWCNLRQLLLYPSLSGDLSLQLLLEVQPVPLVSLQGAAIHPTLTLLKKWKKKIPCKQAIEKQTNAGVLNE